MMNKRWISALLSLLLTLTLLPAVALASGFSGVNRWSTLKICDGSSGDYDVRGLTRDGREIRTTYGAAGYETHLSPNNGVSASRVYFSAQGTFVSSGIAGLSVAAASEFVSAERFLKITYTLKNTGSSDIAGVALGVCADVQIGDDDSAKITRTPTGFTMVNDNDYDSDPGKGKQFTLACTNTAGADNVDTMWFGRYPQHDDNLFNSTPAATTEFSGADSALAFSWKDIAIPAGGEVTRSVLFSVSEDADAPQTNGQRPTLYLSATGQQRIAVNARVSDVAGLTDTLYYTLSGAGFDGSLERTLGSVVAAGSSAVKVISGVIDLSSAATGRYTLQMWIMNNLGAMTEVVTKTVDISDVGAISEVDGEGNVMPLPLISNDPAAVQPLATPTNVAWDYSASAGTATARWDAVAGVTGYHVQLYRNSIEECGQLVHTSATQHDFTAAMRQTGDGDYTFTVMSATDDTNSAAIESGVLSYTVPRSPGGALSAPLTQDMVNAVFGAGTATLAANGSIVLNSAATLDAPVNVQSGLTIDLNGYTITAPGGTPQAPNGQPAIAVDSGAALNLTNSGAHGGVVSGGNGTAGGNGGAAVTVAQGGSVTVGQSVALQGGSGGAGSAGGNGGSGVQGESAASVMLEQQSSATGGNGGNGTSGAGGQGGAGAAAGNVTVQSGAAATGGYGGTGTSGGNGGDGVVVSGTGNISGTATGGDGGRGTSGGNGGAGANATGGTLSGNGTLRGGNGGNAEGAGTAGSGGTGAAGAAAPGGASVVSGSNGTGGSGGKEDEDTGGSGGGYSLPVASSVAYNHQNASKATIWLTASGLAGGDLLITTPITSGSDAGAMRAQAGGARIFRIYDIRLSSGLHRFTDGRLSFDLNEKYAGMPFTLVHKKADGSFEAFHATADANGNLSFGPISELSPFMLLHGSVSGAAQNTLTPPKTGDPAPYALMSIALSLSGAGPWLARRRKA